MLLGEGVYGVTKRQYCKQMRAGVSEASNDDPELQWLNKKLLKLKA